MREGWKTIRIGQALTLEYGKPLPPEDRDDAGKYAAYGANGIKCRTNKYLIDGPGIIVGRKGSAGEITLTERKFWPLDVTYYVKLDEKKYDLMFIFHVLQSLALQKLAGGVKPGLNRNKAYEIEFSFPPLPEQKRIVAILDEAFAGIATAVANAEKNHANSRELFESHLDAVFTQKGEGWITATLADVSDIQSGAGFPHKFQGKNEGAYPFYKVSDMNLPGNEESMTTAINYITEEVRHQLGARIFPRGSLVFPKVGGVDSRFKRISEAIKQTGSGRSCQGL